MPLNRILCCISFSDASVPLVRWATSLAALYDAEVRLLHVRRGGLGSCSGGQEDHDYLLERLFALGRRMAGRPRISAAVAEGDVAIEMTRCALLTGPDVIVLGVNTASPRSTSLVAQAIAAVRRPVLAVPDSAPLDGGFSSLCDVLCVADEGSAPAETARYAVEISKRTGGGVSIVRVVPEGSDTVWAPAVGALWPSELAFRGSTIVVTGTPAVEIVRVAHACASGLIVMSVDPYDPADCIDGTTADVIRKAGCPVLLIPAPSCPVSTLH